LAARIPRAAQERPLGMDWLIGCDFSRSAELFRRQIDL
jgi:hypothetical protein